MRVHSFPKLHELFQFLFPVLLFIQYIRVHFSSNVVDCSRCIQLYLCTSPIRCWMGMRGSCRAQPSTEAKQTDLKQAVTIYH